VRRKLLRRRYVRRGEKKDEARSESCGPHPFVSRWRLLYLDATEVAVTFEIECLGAVGMLGVAVAVHAGKGGIDAVNDTDVFVDTDFHAAEAAVKCDDGTVRDVGTSQVEAGVAEAGVHLGTFETLATVAVVLLAEAHVNLVHLAAIHDNGLLATGGMAMAAATLLAEEQQRDAPYHGHKANHIFPDIGPENDVACRQKQQDADAEADDGAGLVLVVEDVDEARHDDEDCPPALKADMNNIQELQGPHDAEGQEGDAADGFAGTVHLMLFYK